MRKLAAMLVGTIVALGWALYILSVALPRGPAMGSDPLVGHWEANDEELDWEFFGDGRIVLSEGPDALRGSWRRLDLGQILVEFDTRGTHETILAQVDVREGGNEALVTIGGQSVRLERTPHEP